MNTQEFLIACGWVQGAGPNFYLPQGHPHLHLGLDGRGMTMDEVGNNASYFNKIAAYGRVKARVDFVALSDGSRGINFVRDRIETKEIKNALLHIVSIVGEGDAADLIKGELYYIINSYGHGYSLPGDTHLT